MIKEYGGYLPLELCEKEDYFAAKCGKQNVLRTNSAKAALHFAIKKMQLRKIYIPHYMCSSVNELFAGSGLELVHYYLNERLLPKLDGIEEGAAILLVNYFGIMEEAVRKEMEKYARVIVDNSHAYFAEPVIRENVYNIYSCRKFIGVPDGGYLIGPDAAFGLDGQPLMLEPDLVSEHFSYLVTSAEHGTNAAYKEKQKSDRYFMGRPLGMSRLTRGMLSAVDYDFIRARRAENFRYLHELLGEYNQLKIEEVHSPAYLYPFLPKCRTKSGNNLKSDLVAERIYVPTLWRELINPEFEGTREYLLSERTAFLPADQRYGRADMEYLAQRVRCLLEEDAI